MSTRIYQRTKDHNEKISGKSRGRKHSLETRRKIGLASKGRKVSEETRRKMSEIRKGKKHSEEWRKKIGISLQGEKHPKWKGGVVPMYEKIRKSFEYRQWRSDVFTRDNFICVLCGVRGGKLQADHIKRFVDVLVENGIKTFEEAVGCEELWNINNGRTLCIECHKKTDTFGGRGNRIRT